MPLDAVPVLPPPSGWTVADLEALPDRDLRYELVDGVPRALPLHRMKHQVATRRLQGAMEAAAPVGTLVVGGIGVALASDQLTLPDLVVLRDAGGDDLVTASEVLIIGEVVDPWSRTDDRHRKPGQYAQAGIPVYIRVELDPPQVVVYALGPDGVYVEAGRAEPGEQVVLTDPFPFTLDPADLLR